MKYYFFYAEEATDGFALTAYKIIRTTMTGETVVVILKSLVYRYLLLNDEDLLAWEADPEDYGRFI